MQRLSVHVQLMDKSEVIFDSNPDYPVIYSIYGLSPAWADPQFSVSSVLPAAPGAGSVKTGFGLIETSAEPAAPSGVSAVSHAPVAAAGEPVTFEERGTETMRPFDKTDGKTEM